MYSLNVRFIYICNQTLRTNHKHARARTNVYMSVRIYSTDSHSLFPDTYTSKHERLMFFTTNLSTVV